MSATTMGDSVQFFVPGLPKPAGSKRAFIIRGKGTRDRVAVTDMSGKAGKDWRQDLRTAALEHFHPLEWSRCAVPLVLALAFSLPRPRAHHGKRGLKPNAPLRPTTRPDVLKLARAVEDALTGILWADDAQIVDERVTKHYADNGHAIGVGIAVRTLS